MGSLAIERSMPGVSGDSFASELGAVEAPRTWDLRQSDKIREIDLGADEAAAVLILGVRGSAEARSVSETLPLVKAGWMDFELIPLRALERICQALQPWRPRVTQGLRADSGPGM
jgi:hypothetical protein